MSHRLCIVIPTFNHASTLGAVVREASLHAPVIVVDDGSTDGTADLLATWPDIDVQTLVPNRGKGAALRSGFARAAGLGFTHALTMDADGQHFASDIPRFLEASRRKPDALILGIRDFENSGAPAARLRVNRMSNTWFRLETGLDLSDTQCGFRCYPLAGLPSPALRSNRYAFELEVLVRMTWAGVPVDTLRIATTYDPAHTGPSHFRTLRDFCSVAWMHGRLAVERRFFRRGPHF